MYYTYKYAGMNASHNNNVFTVVCYYPCALVSQSIISTALLFLLHIPLQKQYTCEYKYVHGGASVLKLYMSRKGSTKVKDLWE